MDAPQAKMPRRNTILICIVAFAVTSVLFINFCDLVYACGCHSLWNGADAHCNIHAHHGKHCPWCSHGMSGYSIIFACIQIPEFAVAFALRRRSWIEGLAGTLLSFPVFGGVVALAVGLWDGYWK